ncbi:Copia protein [Vitis vinifera]|uniref:Copia protein n=1 Tax=Vitis vinifera TaxID=29760 RepID=A0A438GYE6_VITVI|nr:Copia protein [Vitis vinifera]
MYQRLVGRVIYLSNRRPKQAMQSIKLCKILEVYYRILHFSWKELGSLGSKKQKIVARSSAEAKFRAMAQGIYELLWLKIILEDLKIKWKMPMRLYCNNKSAINIAHNLVQHDRTKHVEVDKHFTKEKLDNSLICTPYVSIRDQLADVLTKGLASTPFQEIIIKLRMDNIYSLA